MSRRGLSFVRDGRDGVRDGLPEARGAPSSRRTPSRSRPGASGLERPYHVYLPGVGGTGVITLNALLSWAALIDGLHVLSYDQTGAAQKWGPVLSSLILARPEHAAAANKVGFGQADLYLALDLLAAGTRVNLERCDPARTVAVVNTSILPSGEMVRNVDFTPPVDAIRGQIDRFTRAGANVAVDARRLSEGLFGDYMTDQHARAGRGLPGRAPAAHGGGDGGGRPPERRGRGPEPSGLPVRPAVGGRSGPGPRARRASGAVVRGRAGGGARAARRAGRERLRVAPRPLRAISTRRRAGSWPSASASWSTTRTPATRPPTWTSCWRWRRARRRSRPGARDVTRAVIRNLLQAHGLQGRVRGRAPPSEARVPRGDARALRGAAPGLLASPPAAPARARAQAEAPARARGSRHPLRALRALRRLRGTPSTPSGTRRCAGRSGASSLGTVGSSPTALAAGGPDAHAAAVELARLPESIRGYEDIKLRSIAKVRGQASTLVSRAATSRST